MKPTVTNEICRRSLHDEILDAMYGFSCIGMDAEQLWETTMDPERRILMRVSMDDAEKVSIDETFSVLMGDKVEPRREFIEKNAKYVRNLDI